MDENPTPQEGTSPEPEVAVEEPTTAEEPVEAPTEPKTYTEEQFKQVWARAKKLEEENKTLKSKPPQQINNQNVPDELIEEKILKANGVDEDMLKEMKALKAVRSKEKGKEVSLLEVQNDPIIKALKKERDDEEKAKKAKLPASRGSGSVKKERTISDSGLSDAEHKALWREMQGR